MTDADRIIAAVDRVGHHVGGLADRLDALEAAAGRKPPARATPGTERSPVLLRSTAAATETLIASVLNLVARVKALEVAVGIQTAAASATAATQSPRSGREHEGTGG